MTESQAVLPKEWTVVDSCWVSKSLSLIWSALPTKQWLTDRERKTLAVEAGRVIRRKIVHRSSWGTTIENHYMRNLIFISFLLLIWMPSIAQSSLAGKKICLDPGHGGTAGTDHYRVGKSGEREEWINLRVALLLKKKLEEQNAVVFLTRSTDSAVELGARGVLAVDHKVDVFISIHHNATADSSVNFPIIYFHGAASENKAGVRLGRLLALTFREEFYASNVPVSLVSDYCIFPEKGARVLRDSYGIPGVLAEASFFTNEEEENKLKQERHNTDEAAAYYRALVRFFESKPPAVEPKKLPGLIPVFPVLQEAGRMSPEALGWRDDFEKALELFRKHDSTSIRTSFELFTRSARSFPIHTQLENVMNTVLKFYANGGE